MLGKIFGILKSKRARLTAGIISIVAVIVFAVKLIFFPTPLMTCNVLLDEEKYPLDSSWSVETENTSVSTAWLDSDSDITMLIMRFYRETPDTVTLRDAEGNEYRLEISLDEDKLPVIS